MFQPMVRQIWYGLYKSTAGFVHILHNPALLECDDKYSKIKVKQF